MTDEATQAAGTSETLAPRPTDDAVANTAPEASENDSYRKVMPDIVRARSKPLNIPLIFTTIAAIISSAAMAVIGFKIWERHNSELLVCFGSTDCALVDATWRSYWGIYASIGAALAGLFAILIWFFRQERRRQLDTELVIHELSQSAFDFRIAEEFSQRSRDGLEQEVSGLQVSPDKEKLPLEDLWVRNGDRLEKYHLLVTNFAQSTRGLTIATLGAGFLFILVLGILAMFADGTAGVISASAITAAGALLTGYLGKAVIANHSRSSKELLDFFSHPIEVERNLSAERIIEQIEDPEKKAEAQMLLVKHLTRPTQSASQKDEESG